MTLNFALFGAGRIGRLHARNLAQHPRARLATVFDVDSSAAKAVADRYDARLAGSIEQALGAAVNAVLIASSTDTHVELITASARAGKAILCEKPIDLSIERVDRCRQEIQSHPVPVQIGFNRRFDPNHQALHQAVRAGEVGPLELVIISSRDPAPPPVGYLEVSGGLFRDMMIHDFDLARFLLGEEPVEISAMASVLVDQAIGDLGDVDTAMVTLKTAGGTLCHINNSRRAVYGYDQRVEVFGSRGMVISDNQRATTVSRFTAQATHVQDPLPAFFLERYAESFRRELDHFIEAVLNEAEPVPSFEDGRQALWLADAALESVRTGRVVPLQS